MSGPIDPTAKAIAEAFERRDQLARELAQLDLAIAAAGRSWGRERGHLMAIRPERLRASVEAELAAAKADEAA